MIPYGTTNVSPTPTPPELIARGQALVRKHPECFWFRNPEARIRHIEDLRLIIEHLREYGDRVTWHEAQDLQKCLLHHSRKTFSPS